jgi:hypothetical protein
MRSCLGNALILSTLVFVQPDEAHSDELFGFVQITCAPEISYFSIRRFQISDLPHKGPFLSEGLRAGRPQIDALQRKYGIYSSKSLSDTPVDCVIPPIDSVPGWSPKLTSGYSARVVGRVETNSDKSSYRDMVDEAEVFLNGKSIGKLWLNPYGFTSGTNSIEISSGQPDLTETRCDSPESELLDKPLVCKESLIRLSPPK